MQGQLFTLLVSSYETLADLLAWMWWALGNEPEVEAAIAAKESTADVGGRLGTRETGDAVAARLRA